MALTESETKTITQRLEQLASKRDYPKTLCPSEVARSFSRRVLRELHTEAWRELMAPLRSLCFKLRDEGLLEILQKGDVLPDDLNEEEIRGPIRIRLKKGQE